MRFDTHFTKRVRCILVFLLALIFAYFSSYSIASNTPIQTPPDEPVVASPSTNTTLSSQPTITRALWVGEKKNVIAVDLADGLPNLYVPAKQLEDIAVDNSRGVVWVGTKKEIIQYKFDGTENFRHSLKQKRHRNEHNQLNCHDDDSNDSVVRISLDPSDGSLWVGAGKEVFKLSRDNRELFRLTGFGQIVDVSVDINDGHCWVAQKKIISKHVSDGMEVFNFEIAKGNEVIALAADPSSHGLWIGTKKKLIKTDQEGIKVFHSNTPDDIQDLKVNTTTNDLWVVTKKDVYKYSKDGKKLLMVPLCAKYGDDDKKNKKNAQEDFEAVHVNCTGGGHEHKRDCRGNLITLAVDSVDNTVWFATGKTLFKLSDAGDLLLMVPGFIQIQALDIGLPKLGITITEPKDGAIFDTSPITVKGIISDPTATVDVNGIKATVTNLDFEAQGVVLSAGTNTITATATNIARQKATDAIQVIYNPANTGPTLLVCPEPYGEQRPRPPVAGCPQQVMLGDIHWSRGYVLGQVDDSVETIVVDGIALMPGGYIYNQGRIQQAAWTGTFFWARMLFDGADGRYPVNAVVTNGQGNPVSATVTFIKDTVAPNIAITSPPDGTITRDQTITATGIVDDPTAIVTDATGNTVPVTNGAFSYQYSLEPSDGVQYIYFEAMDRALNSTSAAVSIVRDSTPPQINVASPADGAITNSQTINISGTITDLNPGTLTMSVNSGPAQPLSSATSFSGTATLTNGPNALLFTATDRAGNVSTLMRTVVLDQTPPDVSVVGIDPNAIISGTASISVTTSDVSGIQSVILLVDGVVKTVLTQGPYTFSLDTLGLTPGNHTITIRVLDRAGNQTDRVIPVSVPHQFGIQITSPGTGATINKSTAIIQGTTNQPAGQEIGVVVNGIPAEQQGNTFAAIVPLQQGQNTITAIATNAYGIQEQTTITINTDTIQNAVRFSVSPTSGITSTTSSFTTTMSVESSITGTIANYSWDTNGDGAGDQTGALLTQITATYQTPGLYFPTVTVTDTMGNTYTDTAIVNVLDRNVIDPLLKSKWDGMKGALMSGNVEGALNYFVEGVQERYRALFSDPARNITARLSEIRRIEIASVEGVTAQAVAIRLESSGERAYPLNYVRDVDGVWKILGF